MRTWRLALLAVAAVGVLGLAVGCVTSTETAGTFPECAEVLMEPLGGRTEMRHWFAPGVGWVRHSSGPRGGRPWVVRYLVDYELHRPEAGAGAGTPPAARKRPPA